MNEITQHDFGLLPREVRDCRAISSNVHHKLSRLLNGVATGPQPSGGLTARLAVVELLAQLEQRAPGDVAKQYFHDDRDLSGLLEMKGAVAPAQTTIAGWAGELVAITVADISDNLLPTSAFAQPLAATAGGGTTALLGDIIALMDAIAPSVKPALIMSAGQAVTFSVLAPAAAVPVVVAPLNIGRASNPVAAGNR
jgi:hypothetical protein